MPRPSPEAARLAAQVATLAIGFTMLIQLLLALGVLPVTIAWGGTQPVLTPGLRLASLAAIVVLGVMAYILRRRAGLVGKGPAPLFIKILAWIVTGYVALNALGNFAAPTAAERWVFGPVALVMVVAGLVIALAREPQPPDALTERTP